MRLTPEATGSSAKAISSLNGHRATGWDDWRTADLSRHTWGIVRAGGFSSGPHAVIGANARGGKPFLAIGIGDRSRDRTQSWVPEQPRGPQRCCPLVTCAAQKHRQVTDAQNRQDAQRPPRAHPAQGHRMRDPLADRQGMTGRAQQPPETQGSRRVADLPRRPGPAPVQPRSSTSTSRASAEHRGFNPNLSAGLLCTSPSGTRECLRRDPASEHAHQRLPQPRWPAAHLSHRFVSQNDCRAMDVQAAPSHEPHLRWPARHQGRAISTTYLKVPTVIWGLFRRPAQSLRREKLVPMTRPCPLADLIHGTEHIQGAEHSRGVDLT